MKSQSLYRHAKTEKDSSTGRDFDRALTDRGQSDAARVGAEMRDLGLSFDLVLASPARRAVETVAGAKVASPSFDERIYDASTGQLLKIVQGVADGVERLLLVGHNPGFEELASMLAGKPIGLSAGALVEIELPIDSWRDAGNDRGRLVYFISPKEPD